MASSDGSTVRTLRQIRPFGLTLSRVVLVCGVWPKGWSDPK
jgi:hypothetical protein